jgi:two-component system response regulator PhcR
MNILLVDDEQFQIDTIKRGIRIHGHQVFAAKSGEEALKYLEEHHDESTLVITDYYMPGMNGITLLKTIREQYGDLPVILMTAFGDKNLLIEALQNGCDNYLDKPFKPNDIVTQIDEIQQQRAKRARRGQEVKKGQSPKDNQAGKDNLIQMPVRHAGPATEAEANNPEAAPELETVNPAPEAAASRPEAEAILADLEDKNPLRRLGGGLRYTVPLFKVGFPLFILLLTGLSTFFLLIAPMFR